MIYLKTSQPVPGKGDAWMYYECNDDQTVRRYLTYIPATGEIDTVAKPFIKKLQRPEMLMPASQEEFSRLWPSDVPFEEPVVSGADPGPQGAGAASGEHFHPDMTIGEAMAVHPQVAEVFAAFHLGGCSSCGIAEVETIAQVCMGYGVEVTMLLDVLEGLPIQDDISTEDETSAATLEH